MITSLEIRNYALIDQLRVDFARGLTIITGETGAGKSIILGGLGLIMGQRADTKALFDADKKCVVEAHFQISDYELRPFFEVHDLDYDDELVIRREISPSGKTRAFVNDTPVKLSILQAISRSLIDLHQQFDTLDIHNVSFQLRMLDALAGNAQRLREYQELYEKYRSGQKELERLETERARMQQEADFVAFQLAEFREAELREGEVEALEQELKTLESAEDIKRSLGQAGVLLVEDERSLVGQLRDLQPGISALEGINAEIDELARRLEQVIVELEDTGQAYLDVAEATEFDAERITEVQDRLSVIFKLQQKHGVSSVEELLTIQRGYEQQRNSHGQIDRQLARLQKQLASQLEDLLLRAESLRTHRQQVVPDFLDRIHTQLGKLSMRNARLAIDFEELDEPGSTGLDRVTYLFSANKGGRMLPIKGVASGGELSRLTLVTKSLVASSIPLPTLIFDEIDAGVSGDVALRMGDILRELSAGHQVVVITHSPQVASKADKHFFVHKEDVGERTATRIRELSVEDRIRALAVMLSSDPPSAPAIENARQLMARDRG